jgi:hypothetical protein
MTRHTLFTLFSLILLSALSKPQSTPFLKLYATESGNITLYQDAEGFRIPVDFVDHENEASDGVSSYDMAVCLYSSQTFLSSYYCLDFFGYSCSAYSECTSYKSSNFSANYVQLSAIGYMMTAPIYLDYNNWYVDGEIGFATSCTSNITLPYGNSRYGMLGMGFANGSQDNYPGSKMFSITLNRSQSEGSLTFHNGSSVEFPSYTPAVTLQTDSNWNINTSAVVTVGYSSIEFDTTVIFDLNSDLLGFPVTIYEYVVQYLETNASMSCNNATFQAVCSYTGNPQNLPNITLTIQDLNIQIPPVIYVQDFYIYNSENGTYSLTLNLRGISPNLMNESYVPPAFENFVILDENFLFYYIPLFNATGYNDSNFEITLYAPPYTNNNNIQPTPTPTPASNSSSGHSWIWIPIGIFCFTILVIIVLHIVRSYRRKKEAALSSTLEESNVPRDEHVYQNLDHPYNMPPQQGYDPNQNYYYPQHQQYPSQAYGK